MEGEVPVRHAFDAAEEPLQRSVEEIRAVQMGHVPGAGHHQRLRPRYPPLRPLGHGGRPDRIELSLHDERGRPAESPHRTGALRRAATA